VRLLRARSNPEGVRCWEAAHLSAQESKGSHLFVALQVRLNVACASP